MSSTKLESVALVIGYQTGTGLLTGQVSHLVCQYHGKMFVVPCRTDSERRNPAKIGVRVVVVYSELVKGVPFEARLQKDIR